MHDDWTEDEELVVAALRAACEAESAEVDRLNEERMRVLDSPTFSRARWALPLATRKLERAIARLYAARDENAPWVSRVVGQA